jgi:hypothetical protein
MLCFLENSLCEAGSVSVTSVGVPRWCLAYRCESHSSLPDLFFISVNLGEFRQILCAGQKFTNCDLRPMQNAHADRLLGQSGGRSWVQDMWVRTYLTRRAGASIIKATRHRLSRKSAHWFSRPRALLLFWCKCSRLLSQWQRHFPAL